jgi:hypothetical protein
LKRKLPLLSLLAAFMLASAPAGVLSQEPAGCLFGLFQSNLPINLEAINETEMLLGKKAGTIMFFVDWTYDFPAEDCARIMKYGAIPLVTWEPWLNWGETDIKPKDITAGKYDAYIRQWADDTRDFKYPIFLRFGHEMNGNWYPWSGAKNGNDASVYVAMYKHVHDIFTKEGANNAIWVWCPNNFSVPSGAWNEASNYYPGDGYVDWLGIDAYNWGKNVQGEICGTLNELAGPMYGVFVSNHPNKPIMLSEYGCFADEDSKAAWMKESLNSLKKSFSKIKAVIWFNIKKERDWRIQSSPQAMAAFTNSIKDRYFMSDPDAMSSILKGFLLPPDAEKLLKKLVILWPKPVLPCEYAPNPPRIDGVISKNEWPAVLKGGEESREISLSKQVQVTMTNKHDPWKGLNDLGGSCKAAWDENNLYILAEVTDDVPFVNTETGDKIWNGDAIELAFGLDAKSDPNRKQFGPADYQLAFLLNDPSSSRRQTWSWQLRKEVEKVSYAVSKNPKGRGYILEASVPWAAFNKFTPAAGTMIPFEFALDDSDESGKGRRMQMVWTGSGEFYHDPSMWGCLKFVK